MAAISSAGPGEGVDNPEKAESYRVTPDEDGYLASHQRPIVLLMWHGNGYKRDDCWLQIDEDAICDLGSYL